MAGQRSVSDAVLRKIVEVCAIAAVVNTAKVEQASGLQHAGYAGSGKPNIKLAMARIVTGNFRLTMR